MSTLGELAAELGFTTIPELRAWSDDLLDHIPDDPAAPVPDDVADLLRDAHAQQPEHDQP